MLAVYIIIYTIHTCTSACPSAVLAAVMAVDIIATNPCTSREVAGIEKKEGIASYFSFSDSVCMQLHVGGIMHTLHLVYCTF